MASALAFLFRSEVQRIVAITTRNRGRPASSRTPSTVATVCGIRAGFGDGSQFDQPDTVWVGIHDRSCNLQCQAGLTDATRTGYSHQSTMAEEVGYVLSFLVVSDETGQW